MPKESTLLEKPVHSQAHRLVEEAWGSQITVPRHGGQGGYVGPHSTRFLEEDNGVSRRQGPLTDQIDWWESWVLSIEQRCRQGLGLRNDGAHGVDGLAEMALILGLCQTLKDQFQQARRALEKQSPGDGNMCEACGT